MLHKTLLSAAVLATLAGASGFALADDNNLDSYAINITSDSNLHPIKAFGARIHRFYFSKHVSKVDNVKTTGNLFSGDAITMAGQAPIVGQFSVPKGSPLGIYFDIRKSEAFGLGCDIHIEAQDGKLTVTPVSHSHACQALTFSTEGTNVNIQYHESMNASK